MTVRRLFVSELPNQGGELWLGQTPARHVRVLRLREGDPVVLFNSEGLVANATIQEIAPKHIRCLVEVPERSASPQTRIILMLAIPKGAKLDDCVRMATELGVDEIALMVTERTIPRWDAIRAVTRVDRLVRIANEASAQSERTDVPFIHHPRSCSALLQCIPPSAERLVFGARTDAPLGALPPYTEQIWCAVGPEGGFTEDELSLFKDAGFVFVSLGNSILRVETAVAASLALVVDRLRNDAQVR